MPVQGDISSGWLFALAEGVFLSALIAAGGYFITEPPRGVVAEERSVAAGAPERKGGAEPVAGKQKRADGGKERKGLAGALGGPEFSGGASKLLQVSLQDSKPGAKDAEPSPAAAAPRKAETPARDSAKAPPEKALPAVRPLEPAPEAKPEPVAPAAKPRKTKLEPYVAELPLTMEPPKPAISAKPAKADTAKTKADAAKPPKKPEAVPPKPETAISAKPAKADTAKTRADTAKPPKKPEAAPPKPETALAAKPKADTAKPPAPAKPPATLLLPVVRGRLSDRVDLDVSMSVEMRFENDAALRWELLFKQDVLSVIAGAALRKHEYGRVNTAVLKADILKTINEQLQSGKLTGVEIMDFQVVAAGN